MSVRRRGFLDPFRLRLRPTDSEVIKDPSTITGGPWSWQKTPASTHEHMRRHPQESGIDHISTFKDPPFPSPCQPLLTQVWKRCPVRSESCTVIVNGVSTSVLLLSSPLSNSSGAWAISTKSRRRSASVGDELVVPASPECATGRSVALRGLQVPNQSMDQGK